MKKHFLTLFLFPFICTISLAQVGINANNSAPAPSAMLDIKSTEKGLLIPRMTTIERGAIQNAAIGLMVFDNDLQEIFILNSDGWKQATISKLPLDITSNSEGILKLTSTKNSSVPTALFINSGGTGSAIKAISNGIFPTIAVESTSPGSGIYVSTTISEAGYFNSTNGRALVGNTGDNIAFTSTNNSINSPTAKITNSSGGNALELNGNLALNGRVILESYQYPILQNNWVNDEGEWNTAKYYKDKQGIVHLEGVLSYGTSILIFNLPIGYRPSKRCIFTISSASGSGRVDVFPNGNVEVMSGQSLLLSLDGISFRVE